MEINNYTFDNINKIIEFEIGIPLELFNSLSDDGQKKIIETKYEKNLKIKTYEFQEKTYLSDGTSILASTYVKKEREKINKEFAKVFSKKMN